MKALQETKTQILFGRLELGETPLEILNSSILAFAI